MESIKQALSMVEGVQGRLNNVADAPLAPLARKRIITEVTNDLEMAKVLINTYLEENDEDSEEAGDGDAEIEED